MKKIILDSKIKNINGTPSHITQTLGQYLLQILTSCRSDENDARAIIDLANRIETHNASTDDEVFTMTDEEYALVEQLLQKRNIIFIANLYANTTDTTEQ